jgi:hypothetical protein
MCNECGCGLNTGLVCPECGGRMVLINNQATCLECKATPPASADPPGEEAHHHHHHSHTGHVQEAGKKTRLDDLTRLCVLLPHWIEHNEEHADSFQHWVARAREMGQDEVAQQIEEAMKRMAACNQALNAALQMLEE